MTNHYKPLRSAQAGILPTTAQMSEGQLAVNSTDTVIYTKSPAGVIVKISQSLTDIWTYILTKILPVTAGGTGVNAITATGLVVGNGASPITTLVPTTAGFVPKAVSVSGTLQWSQDFPLTNWTEGANITAPNVTVAVSWLTPRVTTTNADASIIPKGSGAFLTQIPDGTVTGGNKRGSFATDMSRSRAAATQVASGTYSSVLGGFGGTASGDYSAVVNGNLNVASGRMSVVLSGMNVTTRGIEAVVAQGNSGNTALGMAQSGDYSFSIDTTGSTATRITTNKAAAGPTNQIVIANNTMVAFVGTIAGFDAVNNQAAAFTLSGVAVRGSTAASTAIVGFVSSNSIANNFPLLNSVAVTAVADTTNGGVGINVTGQSGRTLRWCGIIRTAEITG